MKRTLLIVGLTVLIGGWLGTMMIEDPGYVLISYGGAAVQTSLWFALLTVVVLVVAVRLVLRLVRTGLSSGANLNLWRADQRKGKARRLTTTGLINLVEGNWSQAGRYLSVSAGESEMPLINYLGAARACHEQGRFEERDRYLREAHERMPEAELAIGITQAQLQHSRGQLEQCLATLKRLPDKPHVTRMLARVHRELGEWHSLWKLLPTLRKQRTESEETIRQLEETAATHLLGDLLDDGEASGEEKQAKAREIWGALSKPARQNDRIVGLYLRCLYATGAGREADKLLTRTLNAGWSDHLIEIYGALSTAEPVKQRAAAEALLKKYPYSAGLKLALGRICIAAGDGAGAREYLEGSLAIEESVEALREMGELLSREGEHLEGGKFLARALELRRQDGPGGETDEPVSPVTMPMI